MDSGSMGASPQRLDRSRQARARYRGVELAGRLYGELPPSIRELRELNRATVGRSTLLVVRGSLLSGHCREVLDPFGVCRLGLRDKVGACSDLVYRRGVQKHT